MDRAIFRKFKDGEVIAWLPDSLANPGRCMFYMHIGQHSEGAYPAATKPASPKEYRLLAEELRRRGYVLRVVKRLTYHYPAYYECGICGSWHAAEWNGDCREDEARYPGPEVFDARHGRGKWREVPMPV